MKIETTEMFDENLIRSIMESYPEASSGFCLTCQKWAYKKCEFVFYDSDSGKTYTVDMPMLKCGLYKLISELKNKKLFLPFDEQNNGTFAYLDAANWDGECADALVQCAIFGKTIYG